MGRPKSTAHAGDIIYRPKGGKLKAYEDKDGRIRWRTYLDAWEMKHLREHYANTPTQELADLFGIHAATINEIAKREGLKKSRDFLIRKCKEGARVAVAVNRKKGFPNMAAARAAVDRNGSRYDFRKLTKEQVERRAANSAAGLRKQIAEEITRVTLGLPQKTKRKLYPRHESAIANNRNHWLFLMRKRGYIYDADNRTLTKKESGKISPITRKTADKYGITIKTA